MEKGLLKMIEFDLDKLSSSKFIFFENLVPSMLEENLSVVYAIWDKEYPERALYVGRTKKLRRRLYGNHLMGPLTNARLKKYLISDLEYPKITDKDLAKQFIRSNCYFKYIVEENYIERGKIEGLLSYVLNVKYMYEEH